MTRFQIFITLLLSVFVIAACSGRDKVNVTGPLAVTENELGPVTKELVKELPGGLVGDTANQRHNSQQLRGEDEDDDGAL